MLDALLNLLTQFGTWSKEIILARSSEADKASTSLRQALVESQIYVGSLRQGANRNSNIEAQLARYWSDASTKLRKFDSKLSESCYEFSNFWTQPGELTVERLSMVSAFIHSTYRRGRRRKLSSIRFKKDVRVIDSPIEKIKKLRGIYFSWKHSQETSVGLIAEEVEQVIPEVVTHDSDSKVATGLDYDMLIPFLVEAVKAQQIEIEFMRTKIDLLYKKHLLST